MLLMPLVCLSSTNKLKTPLYYANQAKYEITHGQIRERTNLALDAIISVAYTQLKQNGHSEEAALLKEQWNNQWYGYLLRVRDIGDHDPLSQWLADTYQKLEDILGKEICEFLHLDDINTVNFALPVVFSCTIAFHKGDYQMHFVPLSGVVTYWGTVLSCWVFTSGIGSFFCSPLGMLTERLMVRYIAPGLSDRIYDTFCMDDAIYYLATKRSPLWD